MIRQILIPTVCILSCLGQGRVSLKPVRGMPFTATAVTESTQTLADGNRIVRNSNALIARDSEGRTRREQKLPGSGASVVFIQDPVAGLAYVLVSQSRLARKLAVSTAETSTAPADIPSAVPKVEPTNIKTEPMGTQIIEGLQADGTRVTRTLAAGQAGNEKPLQIVSETWYSTDLQTILMRKTTDPRLGETVYRLTDIQRDEPGPLLFEVPADYAIRDASPSLETRSIEKSKN